MAKELPYFKFEPAEYLTKDISFCSLSAQGLFINICSYYWQRNCKLTKEQLLKRLNHETELNELIQEGVVDLIQNNIFIKFLDNQLSEVEIKSKTNFINGSKGGRPKKNPNETETKPNQNPNETQTISETKGIREDKIKEDNINISLSLENDFLTFWNIYNKKNDSKKCKDKFIKLPKKDIDKILEVVKDYVNSTPDVQFRKNPLTWLNGKCWNDIEKNEYSPTPDKPFGKTNQI
jgi:hypothetical protein